MQSLGPFSRQSAKAAIRELSGGVFMMRMTGALTVEAVDEFGRQLNAAHGREAVGWVFDYRHAALIATDDDLARLSRVPHPDALMRPAAFVCPAHLEPVLRRQAIRMASMGYPRRVFLTVPNALAYVRSEAALQRLHFQGPKGTP